MKKTDHIVSHNNKPDIYARHKSNLIVRCLLSSLLAVSVFVFWAFPYRAALSYQEQFQLFQTVPEYLRMLIARPGGMSVYVGEFLVQFYNNLWIGATVLTLVFVMLQILTWRLAVNITHKAYSSGYYALTLVPVVALWLYMGDTNVMSAYWVSLLMALVVSLPFASIKGKMARTIYAIIAIPLFYWLFGPSVLMLALLICVKVFHIDSTITYRSLSCLLILLYMCAVVVGLSETVNYPLDVQLVGIGYYRVPGNLPLLQYAVMLIFVVVVALADLHCFYGKYMSSWTSAAVVVLSTVIIMALSFCLFYDSRTYELVEYDFLIRTNNWKAVINKAEKRSSMLPLGVCATNLALGMEGQLDTRAFQFYQNGSEGLIPIFRKEPNSSMMTGEVFYQLGLVNTAQRFYFEAMESLPNYNKSCRCLKRLAETNMIRGDYEVSKKYLKLLENTIFYKKWARRQLAMIDDPKTIDQHQQYGRLRHGQINDDFLFSDREMDKIVGQLYLSGTSNRLARQYLMLYPLLERDLDRFVQYMQVIHQSVPQYNPPLAQQAALIACVMAGQDIPDGLADMATRHRFQNFAEIWTKEGKNSPSLESFRNSLWYYLVKGNDDE